MTTSLLLCFCLLTCVILSATEAALSSGAAAVRSIHRLPRGGFLKLKSRSKKDQKRKRTLPILHVESRSSQAELAVEEKKVNKEKKSGSDKQTQRKFRDDGQSRRRSALDRTIDFLEAPSTDMTIGVATIVLVCYELGREIRKLGMAKALGEVNLALLMVVVARFFKALLSCLKSTKQALRGYRTYTIVKRGKNVYLRQVPAAIDEDGGGGKDEDIHREVIT